MMRNFLFALLSVVFLNSCQSQNHKPGDLLDSLNGVQVYYNGGMTATHGRNTKDGYNVGLKYQCVEFVKRYYLEHFHHKMPDSYGHAKDFYNKKLPDVSLNKARNLMQYANGGSTKPKVGDLIIFDGWALNPYGHVAIVGIVKADKIQIIQQNVGSKTRETISLSEKNGKFTLESDGLLGWLRKVN
jgi:surface antigen